MLAAGLNNLPLAGFILDRARDGARFALIDALRRDKLLERLAQHLHLAGGERAGQLGEAEGVVAGADVARRGRRGSADSLAVSPVQGEQQVSQASHHCADV